MKWKNLSTIGALAIALTVGGISSAKAGEISDLLKGNLQVPTAVGFSEFTDPKLSDKKLFAFYFSASWCPPCHVFTPKLIKFYEKYKGATPSWELILVSDDRTEKAMLNYMISKKIPFPAIAFDERMSIGSRYPADGIPRLLVVDADGNVVSDSIRGYEYVGPGQVLADLEKILKK